MIRTVDEVKAAYRNIVERIEAAGGDGVSVLPVTKGFGPEVYDLVTALGCDAVGENYVQEVMAKIDHLPDGVGVHMIGRLQRNKVRFLAGRVALYESVDRISVVTEIAKRDPGAAVLIQVTTDDDPAKGGCRLDDVDALADSVSDHDLQLWGLMTVGPTTGGPEAARPGFAAVRAAVDRMGLTICSMGMSADLEIAVAEGTTQVRVGSDLFGPRPYPAENR